MLLEIGIPAKDFKEFPDFFLKDILEKQINIVQLLIFKGVIPAEIKSAFQILDLGIQNERFVKQVSLTHIGVKKESLDTAFKLIAIGVDE